MITHTSTPALAIHDAANYVGADRDETYALAQLPRLTVSLARIVTREHQPLGRELKHRLAPYGLTHKLLPAPIIRGLRLADSPDDAGNVIFADVQYAVEGFCATYGGRMDDQQHRVLWQCYMD